MKNKVSRARPGIYVQGIIFILLFTIFGALLPSYNGNKVFPILMFLTWSMCNYFCRMIGRRFIAGCMSAIFLAVMTSIGFSFDLGFLNPIDVFLAERSSLFSIGSTGKLLVLLGACCGIRMMNVAIDSINDTIVGKVGYLKRFSNFCAGLIGPAVAIVIIVIGSKVQNKIESKKIDTLITFAEKAVHPKDEKPVVSGTDWRYSSLPKDALEQIKMFENAPLVVGKIKVSILAKDPLKPSVIQVGYGITDAEIQEAINYGFLPKGSSLPKRMTKVEADTWFEKITIPTYLAQVKDVVNPKVKLNGYEIIGLYSFCHNLGKDNLKSLIATPGRLNDGNKAATITAMSKYCNVFNIVKGKTVKKVHKGLVKRRAWEIANMQTSLLETPTLL